MMKVPRSESWSRIMVLAVIFLYAAPENLRAESAEDLYKKAFQHSLEGNSGKAIDAYQRALRIKPDFAEAHHGLAVLYFETGEGVRAIDHFRTAETHYRNRTDPQARKNLPIVRKNLEKAYRKLELAPEDFEEIPTASSQGKWQFSGVGFLIGESGYLLTPYHGVKDAENIRIRFPDSQTFPVETVRHFIVYDLSVLKLNKTSAFPKTVLWFGDSSRLGEGDPVFAVDFNKLLQPGELVRAGTIQGLDAFEGDDKILRINLRIKKEHSGGPLFNESGEVVGMTFSHHYAEKNFTLMRYVDESTSFAVKSSYLSRVMSDIIKAPKNPSQNKPGEAGRGMPLKLSGEAAKNFVFVEIIN